MTKFNSSTKKDESWAPKELLMRSISAAVQICKDTSKTPSVHSKLQNQSRAKKGSSSNCKSKVGVRADKEKNMPHPLGNCREQVEYARVVWPSSKPDNETADRGKPLSNHMHRQRLREISSVHAKKVWKSSSHIMCSEVSRPHSMVSSHHKRVRKMTDQRMWITMQIFQQKSTQCPVLPSKLRAPWKRISTMTGSRGETHFSKCWNFNGKQQ